MGNTGAFSGAGLTIVERMAPGNSDAQVKTSTLNLAWACPRHMLPSLALPAILASYGCSGKALGAGVGEWQTVPIMSNQLLVVRLKVLTSALTMSRRYLDVLRGNPPGFVLHL